MAESSRKEADALATRVWLQVDDDDAWALASVEEHFGGSVHLKRSHAPEGVKDTITVSEQAFAELSVATGDLEEPVADLVNLNDVNIASMLHQLRLRCHARRVACIGGLR